jgi:hypothetical protein
MVQRERTLGIAGETGGTPLSFSGPRGSGPEWWKRTLKLGPGPVAGETASPRHSGAITTLSPIGVPGRLSWAVEGCRLPQGLERGRRLEVEKVTGDAMSVTVTVTDTGEGIAPEHLPHLGERFYRVDAARSAGTGGTGLGLAICRSITGAHGGRMTIESKVGEGTAVRIRLLLSPPRT